jgi:two-component system copper resistance phosphate regulon response regulator CusR
MHQSRILVVEADDGIARGLVSGFTAAGFGVRTMDMGDEAAASLSASAAAVAASSGAAHLSADLVILGWTLPGLDGLALLRRLRSLGQRIPVILLTARGAVDDRVLGLDAGADDCLEKPFVFAELLARVRALLRRAATPRIPCQRAVGDLVINLETRLVTRSGRAIDLTPREFDLLAYLAIYHDEVVSRGQIARDVWRENNRVVPIDNVIDVHVARLRRKIGDTQPGRLLHTIRGLGYMLSAP